MRGLSKVECNGCKKKFAPLHSDVYKIVGPPIRYAGSNIRLCRVETVVDCPQCSTTYELKSENISEGSYVCRCET
jgi:hypothetical protein